MSSSSATRSVMVGLEPGTRIAVYPTFQGRVRGDWQTRDAALTLPARRNNLVAMYEHFEHTADLGLRVRAADLHTLFAQAAIALTAAIVEDVMAIEPRQKVALVMSSKDVEYLLL